MGQWVTRAVPSHPRRAFGSGVAAVLLAFLAGCATQDALPPGAQVVGTSAAAKTQALAVDTVGGFLGAGYLFTREDSTGSTQERLEHLVQERVGLGASGSVYSPSFLRYEATGVVGLSQDRAEDQTTSSSDTGELYEADVGAYLFPERIHPADVFFGRVQDFQPRVFFSQTEVTSTTARATQHLKLEDLRLQVHALYREQEQTVFGREATPFADYTESTLGAGADYRISGRQNLTADYSYQDVRQTQAENSYTAHDLLATHAWFFTEDTDVDLRSRFEGRSQDGDLDQQLLRWNENLNARLLESLWGDAGIAFEENDTNLLEQRIFRGDAGLRHQLFESLSSTLRFPIERVEVNGETTTDILGGTLSLNYRKQTGLGALRMNYTGLLERRITDSGRGGAIDEPRTFPAVPPEEVRLQQPRIDVSSIVVTDLTGVVFYRLDLDYTIRQDSSGITFVTRVFTGNIPLGGTILVDYVFDLGGDFTLDTVNHNFRAEHEFTGGWAPYFGVLYQDQKVRDAEATAMVDPVRERSLLGGLEWRQPAFVLGAEYENRESTILPFDAVRLRAQGSRRLDERHQLTGNAVQTWLFYEDPERDLAISQANARWRSSVGRRTSMYGDVAIRYQDDSFEGDSFGFSIGGGLEYLWRRFTIRLRAAYRETRGVTSDFRGVEVGLWIVREFGAPPPTTSAAINRFLRQ